MAIDETTKAESWRKAKEIFHIDEKPNYDLLPIEIKQRVQPHFTNRDKNTFGKIAAKIGKRFSDSIQKNLVETETSGEYLLATYFEYLAESIALLEASLDIVLSKELDVLKTVKVYEKQTVIVSIKVGDSDSKEITVNHFVDSDSNYDLYLSKSYFHSKSKLSAEAVSELFVKILDRDLRKFNLTLFDFLDRDDKLEYLKLHEISDDRIREIKDKLIVSELTPLQKFWDAILLAKGIYDREGIFIDKGISVNKLAEQIGVTPANIQHFLDSFDFNDVNNVLNIKPVSELLNLLSISLAKANEFLFPKIDFRDFYNKQLIQLKNKYQKRFEAFLHNYLKSKTLDEKANYQNTVDSYKFNFNFSVPINSISIDIEEFFVASLNKQFSSIKFTRNDLNNSSFKEFDTTEIFKTQHDLLVKQLNSEKYTAEQLDKFLLENKRRSLLYFNETKFLANAFQAWLKETSERKKTTQEEDLTTILSEFSNTDSSEIEVVAVSSVDLPNGGGHGGGGGGGRRFDGGAGEKGKKIIGAVAEMLVFEKLQKKYKEVSWVSKNASKVDKNHPGYNPEGDDSLGYDIEYLDDDGNKFFIEVKGKADNFDSFEISKNEINKAHSAKELYKVIFVSNVMDKANRRFKDLGNLFLLEKHEDFFSNNKFTVIYKSFEIRFQGNQVAIK